MMENIELKESIRKLEEKKMKLIGEIRKLNDRKRYKNYEKKALEPFVEKTKTVRIGPLKKQMKALEFKITTQAYTPQKERLLRKELKKVEDEYKKIKEVERARRKLQLVSADLEEIDSGIDKIEIGLKEIRDELGGLYKKQKMGKVAKSKGINLGKADEGFSLMDVAEIENEE